MLMPLLLGAAPLAAEGADVVLVVTDDVIETATLSPTEIGAVVDFIVQQKDHWRIHG